MKFKWSTQAQLAFENLKNSLIQAPVLTHPDPTKPLEIHCDASDVGLGAVLSQNNKPIAFISRTLSSAERNYTVTEREILAVVFGLEKLKIYFNSLPIKVITDHAALTRLYTAKNLSPRVIRWSLKLQEYNFQIEHKPGKDNLVADCLSRTPCVKEDVGMKCCVLNSVVLDSRDTVIRELKLDEEFGELYKYMLDEENYTGTNKSILENKARNYEIIDELLFYKKPNQFGEYKPVIPKSLRIAILREIHDLPSAGHCGIRKTFAKATQTVFWPKMKEFVTQYIQTCDKCQRFNYVNYKPAGYLKNINSSFPNEIVGIDLLGPYPRSSLGKYRYILVIVDHFSKWVELIPMHRASAKTVRDSFVNKYVLRYGAPLKIISDNGPQFVSSLFSQMCERLNILHAKMVPYRPQSNIAERVNRNVLKLLKLYVENNHNSWDLHIDELAFALRTVQSDTTRKTPAELFLGRKIITPLDRLFLVADREPEFAVQDIEKLVKEANICSEKARKQQALYYNQHRRSVKLNVGDKVLKIKHSLSSASANFVAKFDAKFEGPYVIVEVKGDNYKIKLDNQILTVNIDQIKKYYSRADMPLFQNATFLNPTGQTPKTSQPSQTETPSVKQAASQTTPSTSTPRNKAPTTQKSKKSKIPVFKKQNKVPKQNEQRKDIVPQAGPSHINFRPRPSFLKRKDFASKVEPNWIDIQKRRRVNGSNNDNRPDISKKRPASNGNIPRPKMFKNKSFPGPSSSKPTEQAQNIPRGVKRKLEKMYNNKNNRDASYPNSKPRQSPISLQKNDKQPSATSSYAGYKSEAHPRPPTEISEGPPRAPRGHQRPQDRPMTSRTQTRNGDNWPPHRRSDRIKQMRSI